MKFFKYIIIVVIVIVLNFTFIGVFAADNEYSDIRVKDWFYNDIKRLSDVSIMEGYADNTFRPYEPITCEEFIKCILNVVGVKFDETGNKDIENLYIEYALKNKFLTADEAAEGKFGVNKPILRGIMTKIIIVAMDIEIAEVDNPFADISNNYINTAYDEYLIRGSYNSDGKLECNMQSYASRAEVAVILNRVLKYLDDPYEYKKEMILNIAENSIISTESEILDFYYVINKEFITEFTFNTSFSITQLKDFYYLGDSLSMDTFQANNISYSYYATSTEVTIKLMYNIDVETIKRRTSNSIDIAESVVKKIINDNMTDEQKVRAIHDYIVLNCEYDYDNYLKGTIPEASYRIYGVFENKIAVCRGYCAAFNTMCRMAGVKAISVSGTADFTGAHTWNAVLINDVIYYIDVTYDDPVPDEKGRVMDTYFMVPENKMDGGMYTWDKDMTQKKYFYRF